jgi:hypothetical protein
LVADGLGLPLARGVAEPEGDGDPEEDGEPGRPGWLEPVDGIGAGEGTGVAGGRAAPPRPAVPAEPCAPGEAAPAHGMIEAPGPPSRPTAITARQISSTTAAPAPHCRIRRDRRPDRSVNTGLP